MEAIEEETESDREGMRVDVIEEEIASIECTRMVARNRRC